MDVPARHYDITRTLRPSLAPWPGDTPFDYRLTWQMAAGAAVNVGAITMSTHNGTHVDAPRHYLADGATIETLDPAIFMGPAYVVDLSATAGLRPGGTIERAHLSSAADRCWDAGGGLGARRGRGGGNVTRLLLKTGAWPGDATFPVSFPTLAPDVPAWLAGLGIRLLGLDVPSVDTVDSKELPIHQALGRAGILILESLDLAEVAEGFYELIALPLKIAGGDAGPARAVLREMME